MIPIPCLQTLLGQLVRHYGSHMLPNLLKKLSARDVWHLIRNKFLVSWSIKISGTVTFNGFGIEFPANLELEVH